MDNNQITCLINPGTKQIVDYKSQFVHMEDLNKFSSKDVIFEFYETKKICGKCFCKTLSGHKYGVMPVYCVDCYIKLKKKEAKRKIICEVKAPGSPCKICFEFKKNVRQIGGNIVCYECN